jgi:anti-sigma factor RsiW
MSCEEVLTRLWEYLDEELAAEEAAEVRLHLSDCLRCHSAYCCDRAFLDLLARQRVRYSAAGILLASIRTGLRPH